MSDAMYNLITWSLEAADINAALALDSLWLAVMAVTIIGVPLILLLGIMNTILIVRLGRQVKRPRKAIVKDLTTKQPGHGIRNRKEKP